MPRYLYEQERRRQGKEKEGRGPSSAGHPSLARASNHSALHPYFGLHHVITLYVSEPKQTRMVLSLSRTIAAQQIKRSFSHQTWVSGIANTSTIGDCPPGPPRTRIAFAEKVAHGVLISCGVCAGQCVFI